MKQRRRIVILYETPAARELAIQSAPELGGAHSRETAKAVHWSSFAQLASAAHAGEAAKRAAAADLVIFAISPAGDFPAQIKLWIERWTGKRSEGEGVIVGLVARHSIPGEVACLKEIYLRRVAHRARMDYLSRVPSGPTRMMPDSPDAYGERARQVTSLLDEILHSRSMPPVARL